MAYNHIWNSNSRKLNSVENIKLTKDGLDVINTIIEKYSKEGFDSVSEEDRILLKWAGIYDQKPKNGYYMMRIRINSCIININQAKVIAQLSREYGRGILKITTRGAIQLYFIKLEYLPDIFRRLEEVGLSTFEACGDCPRTIVGNPLAGIDPKESMDTTELVEEVNHFFLLNRDFSNLPRKFKISISSSSSNSGHREINDLSFTPATKVVNHTLKNGFHVWVGGGLSVRPILAKQLDLFVLPEEVLTVAIGAATIFRDYGYRESRAHARLKFLVDDWGTEQFKNKLLELTGPLLECGCDRTEEWDSSYYYGIHPQKQEGKSYLGLHVPYGYLQCDTLTELSNIAKAYGDSKLRTTMSQNIIVSGLEQSQLEKILQLPLITEMSPENAGYEKNMIVCTGSDFCNLALVDTKARAKEIADYLNREIDEVPLRINIVGCPNSCGHAWIADIGLRGCLIKSEQGMQEAFELMLGGTLGLDASFATKMNGKIAAEKLPPLLKEIIIFYQQNHSDGEDFHSFLTKQNLEKVQEMINPYI